MVGSPYICRSTCVHSGLLGLQILPSWQKFFNFPKGIALGMCWKIVVRRLSEPFPRPHQFRTKYRRNNGMLVMLPILKSLGNNISTQALPFVPLFSDNFGRRASMFLGALIMLAGVVMQWAATSVPVFIGARVVSKYRAYYNYFLVW